jgi:Membrane bound beta barrel domain (DUF5777)
MIRHLQTRLRRPCLKGLIGIQGVKRLSAAVLALAAGASAYYPGLPDRFLATLPTAEVTPNQHVFTRFAHRFEEPIAPAGENNPFYHLLGMDGSANIYFDVAAGFANLGEVTLGREREYKTYSLEGKILPWSQRFDHKPISLAFTLNAQVRTERGLEDDKRLSLGGSAIISRSLFGDRLDLLGHAMAQSHTNVTETGESPDHSLAAALGVIWRIDRLSLFGELIVPLAFGDIGYRRTYAGRAENGIMPIGAGFNYRIYNHAFALTVTNYTSMLPAQYTSGAHSPGLSRLHEWRLGFNLTRLFKLGH